MSEVGAGAGEGTIDEQIRKAIRDDDLKKFKNIIKANPDILEKSFQPFDDSEVSLNGNVNLLQLAVQVRADKIIKYLVEKQWDLDAVPSNGNQDTPLMIAVRAKDIWLVHYLLDNKAEPLGNTKSQGRVMIDYLRSSEPIFMYIRQMIINAINKDELDLNIPDWEDSPWEHESSEESTQEDEESSQEDEDPTLSGLIELVENLGLTDPTTEVGVSNAATSSSSTSTQRSNVGASSSSTSTQRSNVGASSSSNLAVDALGAGAGAEAAPTQSSNVGVLETDLSGYETDPNQSAHSSDTETSKSSQSTPTSQTRPKKMIRKDEQKGGKRTYRKSKSARKHTYRKQKRTTQKQKSFRKKTLHKKH